ncbi:unnamed protein product [Phytomonas sp. Hart1]|nr:unnamed protein product [Phytomonas sp. Hart1]|eukprot:CCW66499.1 unnamed protein product [Phytomonas sp. isolate Hart1]
MLRLTLSCFYLKKVFQVTKPPVSGYELVELPNEKVLNEFMLHFKKKAILVIVHSGDTGLGEIHADSSKLGRTKNKPVLKTGMSDNNINLKRNSYSAFHDPLTRTFVSSLNKVNLGNPDELRIALVPGPKTPDLVNKYSILTYPTTLLFVESRYVDRCVGARSRELSIKSLFMLRNNGRDVFSRE